MKFFRQTKNNSCNIIAIQHVLSFFNKYPSFEEIDRELPQHSFGDYLQEIGIYLDKKGIKSTLVSNHDENNNKLFRKTLAKYKKIENFENRIPSEKDIRNKPVIVNVDAFKVRRRKEDPVAHFVVLVREGKNLYLYDGANFKRKVKRSFEEIYNASLDINKFHENGMWLFIR